jgi:hypothetical protein
MSSIYKLLSVVIVLGVLVFACSKKDDAQPADSSGKVIDTMRVKGSNANQDQMVLTIKSQNGETRQYYVALSFYQANPCIGYIIDKADNGDPYKITSTKPNY